MGAEDVFRNANDRIAEKAAAFGWCDPVPFLCECSDIGCFARLPMTLEELASRRASPSRYVIKPGHRLSGGFVLEEDDHVAVAEKLYAGQKT